MVGSRWGRQIYANELTTSQDDGNNLIMPTSRDFWLSTDSNRSALKPEHSLLPRNIIFLMQHTRGELLNSDFRLLIGSDSWILFARTQNQVNATALRDQKILLTFSVGLRKKRGSLFEETLIAWMSMNNWQQEHAGECEKFFFFSFLSDYSNERWLNWAVFVRQREFVCICD